MKTKEQIQERIDQYHKERLSLYEQITSDIGISLLNHINQATQQLNSRVNELEWILKDE